MGSISGLNPGGIEGLNHIPGSVSIKSCCDSGLQLLNITCILKFRALSGLPRTALSTLEAPCPQVQASMFAAQTFENAYLAPARWTLDLSSLNCVEKDSESTSTGVERSTGVECTCHSGGRGRGPCASSPLSWPSSLEEVDETCWLTIC